MPYEFVVINPGEVPTKVLHSHLLAAVGPRPIGFASTINRDGLSNLSPFSFFNVFSANPPIAIFSPARRVKDNTRKHTLENVYQVPEVVINVVSFDIVEQMNLSSGEFAAGVNEFEKSGLTPVASELVRPFRVLESPVQMESRVVEIKPLSNVGGAGQLIFCKLLRVHIRKDILNPDGSINQQKIDLVGRMGAEDYVRASGEALFQLDKPVRPGIGVDAMPAAIRESGILTGNELGKLGSLPEFPGKDEIETFSGGEGKDMLQTATDAPSRHRAASKLISEGKTKQALMFLLA